ncbi:glycosyltransferase family 25 protein [Devosia honganensis]|uniref:Glycosyltransferase family 25 protein n=1 Tax=Devosia honganensis TaxID=1610527 RepID=A0ABV7X0G5_9HYPH
MLPIYYINLDSRPDRRAFMEAQLASLGLEGTRVSAATPADLTPEEVALYCDGRKPRYLRCKELACSLSHERVWKRMVTAGNRWALVLEDDAELSPLLPNFLESLGNFDTDLIRLEATGPTIRVFPPIANIVGIGLRPFRSTPMGSAGYVLSNRAAKLLVGHPAFRQRQTDLALYNPFDEPGASIRRVQAVPGLCQQLGSMRPDKLSIGRSDIAPVDEPHLYAKEHPLRYRLGRLREGLTEGWRNARDHFASKKQGLTRMSIPFADGTWTGSDLIPRPPAARRNGGPSAG